MNIHPIPIIAIDGTSSSGKGTLAYRLALHFGYNYLNSGSIPHYLVIKDKIVLNYFAPRPSQNSRLFKYLNQIDNIHK